MFSLILFLVTVISNIVIIIFLAYLESVFLSVAYHKVATLALPGISAHC